MSKSDVDVTGFSKPATKLIEKVSDAVGGLLKPWQTKRVAKAEAQASMIAAEARVQISEIERRGIERLVREEGKNQENIEKITLLAAERVASSADADNLDEDWIRYFFEFARLISDEKIQEIWANILANQSEKDSDFSKSTLYTLSKLSKTDIELIQTIRNFCWNFERTDKFQWNIPIFTHAVMKNLSVFDIGFPKLQHLDYLGIIRILPPGSYVSISKESDDIEYVHYGERTFTPVSDQDGVDIGRINFTLAGYELSKLCRFTKDETYFQYVIDDIGNSLIETNKNNP